MKKLISVLVLIAGCSPSRELRPAWDNPETVWSVDLIRLLPGGRDPYVTNIQENWAQARDIALRGGDVISFRALDTGQDGAGEWQVILMTEYADSARWADREAIFRRIFESADFERVAIGRPSSELREFVAGGAVLKEVAGSAPNAQLEPISSERATGESAADTSAVYRAIASYYDVFSDRDWLEFGNHFWPGATLSTVWTPEGETADRVVATTIPDFVKQAPLGPGSQPIFEERMVGSRIWTTGNLAHAWVQYEAKFGSPGSVMEWSGTDAITLMKHSGEWRIVSIAYTSDT